MVPDQGSGEGLVLPHTTTHSAVTLNGHRVNPLKANPPAAARGGRRRGGEYEEEGSTDSEEKKRQKKRREEGKGA